MLKNISILLLGLILGSLLTTYFLYRRGYYTPALFDLNIYLLVNTAFSVISFYILSLISVGIFKYSFKSNDFIVGFLFASGINIGWIFISFIEKNILKIREHLYVISLIILPILIYGILILLDTLAIYFKKR